MVESLNLSVYSIVLVGVGKIKGQYHIIFLAYIYITPAIPTHPLDLLGFYVQNEAPFTYYKLICILRKGSNIRFIL